MHLTPPPGGGQPDTVARRRGDEPDDLLAAVLADPSEDAPRLALADHLAAAGRHERATLIRVQCELGRMTEAVRQTPTGLALRRSQYCLLARCRVELLPAGVGWVADAVNTSGVWYADGVRGAVVCCVRRGFVAELRLPRLALVGRLCRRCPQRVAAGQGCRECGGGGWVGRLPAHLSHAHPVERVVLTARRRTPAGAVTAARVGRSPSASPSFAGRSTGWRAA